MCKTNYDPWNALEPLWNNVKQFDSSETLIGFKEKTYRIVPLLKQKNP